MPSSGAADGALGMKRWWSASGSREGLSQLFGSSRWTGGNIRWSAGSRIPL